MYCNPTAFAYEENIENVTIREYNIFWFIIHA